MSAVASTCSVIHEHAAAAHNGEVTRKLASLVQQLESYEGGSPAQFNATLKDLCGSDALVKAIVTLICATSASNVNGVLGFNKVGLRERVVEALEQTATTAAAKSWATKARASLLSLSSTFQSESQSQSLSLSLGASSMSVEEIVKDMMSLEESEAGSPVVASSSPGKISILSDGEEAEMEGKLESFMEATHPGHPAEKVRDAGPAKPQLSDYDLLPIRPATAPAASGSMSSLDAFAFGDGNGDGGAPSPTPMYGSGARAARGRGGGSGGGKASLLGTYDLKAQTKDRKSPSPGPGTPSYMLPRTSLGLDKLAGRGRSAGSVRSRKTPVPSYMLPTGKTRFSSPEPRPDVTTREVEELFRHTNLLSDVPQEEENRRLLGLLRQKAASCKGLVEEADLMWRKRLSASLDVSMGSLKKEHDRELNELKVEFEDFKPNDRLVEAMREDKFLAPPIMTKTIKPSKEHKEYLQRQIKAQEEHNITRFLVKRSALLIRQGEQRSKMKKSLGGAYSRLDRIRETQLEAIAAVMTRVEQKVAHTERLHDAVAPLISVQPKIQSKRATLEALEALRHGLRLMADLASKIPDLYESVCIADGPIEASLPNTDFAPLTPNFYPRSVVHGRSREDLIKELSSFLPYGDKSHLRSRSPSRERSRSRSPSGGGLPKLTGDDDGTRPVSAPAGIFVSSSVGRGGGNRSAASGAVAAARTKSAGGRRKEAGLAATAGTAAGSGAVLWSGEGFDGAAPGGEGSQAHSAKAAAGVLAHPDASDVAAAREMTPLDYYRMTMEAQKMSRMRGAEKATKRAAFAAAAAAAAKRKKKPLPSWADYLQQDGRCPWCLEMFSGNGYCLPSVQGPDPSTVARVRDAQIEAQQRAMSSAETTRHLQRLLQEQDKIRRQQGRSPNESLPFKCCSWECLKQHTIKHCQKRMVFHYSTLIDVAAGYIVSIE